MVPYLLYNRFDWQAIQATFRLEDIASSQSQVAGSERTKRSDAVRALNASKADLKKAKDQLEEMKRARDTAESALTAAEKLVLDQTERLLKTED